MTKRVTNPKRAGRKPGTGKRKGHSHIINGKQVRSREYVAWCAMRQRCKGKGHPEQYQRIYVDRGIAVAPEWQDFDCFLSDMGPHPGPGYSIDRIDNDKGYGPGNCRWVTTKAQNRNTRRTKLTDTDVADIRRLLARGLTQVEVAQLFRVAKNVVWEIKHGKSWTADLPNYP
jgi:hypothetical protein